jgi:glycosyltransferase involved in cell wall biosynthesis
MTGRLLIRFRHNLYPVGRDPLTRLIYAMPDRIVAISEEVKNVLVRCKVKNEISTIHDSVNTEIFNVDIGRDIRKEINIDKNAIVIGNTSTFTYVKGQEILLNAFNIINSKIDCILLFAGRLVDESKKQYLSHVHEKFRHKVIFLGHREDVACVLKTIDVFVYPSILEGLGTALLEAMAMERPVVVSDIPTFRYFIRDGVNGIFFKSSDPEKLAEKVLTLIRDRNLRTKIAKDARATILEKFSYSHMIDKTEALYKTFL